MEGFDVNFSNNFWEEIKKSPFNNDDCLEDFNDLLGGSFFDFDAKDLSDLMQVEQFLIDDQSWLYEDGKDDKDGQFTPPPMAAQKKVETQMQTIVPQRRWDVCSRIGIQNVSLSKPASCATSSKIAFATEGNVHKLGIISSDFSAKPPNISVASIKGFCTALSFLDSHQISFAVAGGEIGIYHERDSSFR